jgi:hypothetical protein
MYASDLDEGNTMEIIVHGWVIVQFLSVLGHPIQKLTDQDI